ncbi:hypothetical protein N8Z91_02330 [Ascidiaceihabitans sp.]|nr:hypothetical protein [Ascidiaceihabitans sp.]
MPEAMHRTSDWHLGDINLMVLAEAAMANKDEMNWLSHQKASELGIIKPALFDDFFLEPYGNGIIAASRATTSITGYDSTRPYYKVGQTTAFCRGRQKFLMLSAEVDGEKIPEKKEVTWWFDSFDGSEQKTFKSYDNFIVRNLDGKAYFDIDVTEFSDQILLSKTLTLSVAFPRYAGGNLTYEKDLTEKELSYIRASFKFCI